MNDSLQGDNVDDDLRRAPGPRRRAADRRGRQPDRHLLRLELDARRADRARQGCGSSARCAGGGSTSSRSAPLNPDGSQAIDDNRIEQLHGQGHVADDGQHPHLVPVQPQPQGPLPPPRLAVSVRRGQGDAAAGPAGAELRRAVQPRGRQARWWSTRRFGRMWGVFPSRYQDEVRPTDIAIRDVGALHAHQRRRDAVAQPEPPLPGQRHLQLLPATRPGPARTTSRSALQMSWERMAYDRIRNGDILLELRDGVPFQAPARQHARSTRTTAEHVGRVPAGPLGDRPRHHQRRRAHRRRQRLPAGAVEPGRHLRRRARLPARPTSSTSRSTSRRASASPTTCSATAGPRSRPTTAASTTSSAREIAEAVNPNALATQTVAWTDANGNLRLDPGSSARSPASPRGLFPTVDHGRRPALQRRDQRRRRAPAGQQPRRRRSATTAASTVTASASSIAPGRPRPTRRSPHLRRSESGQTQSITIYNLRPEFGTLRDRFITNVDVLESDYDGVHVRRPEADVEPLADAGRPDAPAATRASTTAAPTRRPAPSTAADAQQPELPDQPRRRLGVHRPAVDVRAVGQLPAAVGHHVLRQVHGPRRRPADRTNVFSFTV